MSKLVKKLAPKDLEHKWKQREITGIKVLSIEHVNHRPHPYTVGNKHISYAHDNCGGLLGDEVLKAVPCAHRGCTLSYEEHLSDFVMFLSLTKDMTHEEISNSLKDIADESEADGVDGFAFVESEFSIVKE